MSESLYHRGPRWKVGNPTNPADDDKEFHREELAIAFANELARTDYQLPVAVWDMSSSDIVHLFVCGQQFRSV